MQLDRCLAAIARQSVAPTEVLVVDNAPRGDAARRVALARGARYLVEPVPGLGRARNAGARAATGDVLLYTDDDAEPETTWVGRTLDEFADPAVVAVAGRIAPLDDGSAAAQEQARAAGFPLGGDERFALDQR